MKKDLLNNEINIYGAITTPNELMRETLVNFLWGFVGNSIVLFISKELDIMVFINFILQTLSTFAVFLKNMAPDWFNVKIFTHLKLSQIFRNIASQRNPMRV